MSEHNLINFPIYVNIWEKIDVKLLRYLLALRKIADRCYFIPYHNKNDFQKELDYIGTDQNVQNLTRPFSYISLNSRDDNVIYKHDILEIVEKSRVNKGAELVLQIIYSYCKQSLEEYEDEIDGYVIDEIINTVVDCLNAYERSKLFQMDKIKEITTNFLIYLIKCIAQMMPQDCNKVKLSYYYFLSNLLLKFKHSNFAQDIIIREVGNMFSSLVKYQRAAMLKSLTPHQSETFALLLNIVEETLATKRNSLEIRCIENEAELENNQYRILSNSLRDILCFVPDYIHMTIQNCLHLL